MIIAGLVKASCVDYPGKLSAVVFTQGCNMRCSFCHNRALLPTSGPPAMAYDPEEVLAWLQTRQGLLDGVVVSGGEPTLRPGLVPFLRRVKELGFALKLDTNGTRPQVVQGLLRQGLVDFIAMDLKAPLRRYREICGSEEVNLDDLRRSVELIKNSGIAYQFRTTLAPQLGQADIQAIREDFLVGEHYVLQPYRPPAGAQLAADGASKVYPLAAAI